MAVWVKRVLVHDLTVYNTVPGTSYWSTRRLRNFVFSTKIFVEIRVELWNFVFSAQDVISGSPNRGRGIRVIVIKTLHHVNSFPET